MAALDVPSEIRTLRESPQLTQEEFARELWVSFTTVSRWENGHGKPSRLAQRQLLELSKRVQDRAARAKRGGDAMQMSIQR